MKTSFNGTTSNVSLAFWEKKGVLKIIRNMGSIGNDRLKCQINLLVNNCGKEYHLSMVKYVYPNLLYKQLKTLDKTAKIKITILKGK